MKSIIKSVIQLFENMAGEMLFDLIVARNRLARSSFGILIPVVLTPMADEDAPAPLNAPDQLEPFHAIRSSAT
jgi:hypothetical protein